MKNLVFIFLISSIASLAQAPEIDWDKSYSSFGYYGNIIQTNDSGFISLGQTGFENILLIKTDPYGVLQWQKILGGSENEEVGSVIQCSDGGYIVLCSTSSDDGDVSGWHIGYDDGYSTHDAWVVKLDSIGNIEWQKCYGGNNDDYGRQILETDDGGFILCNVSLSNNGDVTDNYGSADYWIVKIDIDGNIDWQKSYGGSSEDDAYSILATADLGYTIAGYSNSDDYDISSNNGFIDFWVVHIDSSGNLIWENSFGGTHGDYGFSITHTFDNGYYVGGWSQSNDGDVSGHHGAWGAWYQNDIWLIKIDSSGNLMWQRSLGGSSDDRTYCIVLDNDGGCLVGGLASTSDGDITGHIGSLDFWVIKLDNLGSIQWDKCYGGSSVEHPHSILKTFDDRIILGGHSYSEDGDISEPIGDNGLWVVKLEPTCVFNTFYIDQDLDGEGNALIYTYSCEDSLEGYVLNSNDCNDYNDSVYIGAPEICNYIDDNCNGLIDEDIILTNYFADLDEDGFGDFLNDSLACNLLIGYISDSTDCNDLDSLINPFAIDICNDIDDNCNFNIDEGLTINTFYIDADSDNFGNSAVFLNSCLTIIAGYVSDSTDCNDANNLIYSGAIEICDYLDNDCNGIIDDNLTYIHSFEDADADNFGNIEVDSFSCEIPDGFVEDDADCDDTNPLIYPGAPEILDGIDNNCNKVIDEGFNSIESLSNLGITVYPNPTNDKITLSINNQFNINSSSNISICDLSGKNILQIEIKSSETEIDVSQFVAGIYFVKVIVDGNQFVRKFIIE